MTTASVAFLHPMRGKTIAMLTRLTFIAAVWPSAAGAQAGAPLRGTVVDRATAAVVANAAISIRLTNDSVVAALHTDSLGRFRFDATPRGVFILQMQKIGFEPTRAAFSTDADTGAVLILMSKINTLDAVTVTATATQRRLESAGFYARRRTGFGHFLDSAMVARVGPPSAVSLLRPYLKGCTRIFVDGVPLLPLRDVDPATIIGVEIYASGVEAPPEFHNPADGGSARCGSIVIWRSHG